MTQRRHNKITFKPYEQNQLRIPMDMDDMIPDNHIVRVINKTIDDMNLEILLKQYKGGGTSSFHPKMLLKVFVYAYTQKIYSSRRIAKALRENIYFLWLSGQSYPDHRTINRFRSTVMKDVIEELFSSVLKVLVDNGYIKLENYFVDGTKIEANANKFTWVWAKKTNNYQAKLQEKLKELFAQIDLINDEENAQYGDKDLEEMGEDAHISAEDLKKTVDKINEILKKKMITEN